MHRMGQEEIDAVSRVINSKNLFKVNKGGQETLHAEEELCALTGAENSLIMTSGHAALVSALVAAGIGPGDQVIVPAYTYIATPIAVLAAGAIPVICEIDESLTLDPDDLENKITPYTKAIMPVHMLGLPCKMDKIMAVAKKHGLLVIEDACQALGATFGGKMVGTIGDAGAYSFNFYKIISTGEGGALVTDNLDLYQKALIYHDSSAVCFFGNQMDGVSVEPFVGSEYRTNEIQAAILREQMKRLDGIVDDLHRVKNYITKGISGKFKVLEANEGGKEQAAQIVILTDTPEVATKLAEYLGASVIVNTKKHVYNGWGSVMNKRGHLNPLMDPFLHEANKDIIPDYRPDMCQKSLDILSKAVLKGISSEWTEAEMDELIAHILAFES